MDPYFVLNVPRNSTLEQIRAAYKKLALRWHPDKNPNNPACKEQFQNIQAAYELLSARAEEDAQRVNLAKQAAAKSKRRAQEQMNQCHTKKRLGQILIERQLQLERMRQEIEEQCRRIELKNLRRENERILERRRRQEERAKEKIRQQKAEREKEKIRIRQQKQENVRRNEAEIQQKLAGMRRQEERLRRARDLSDIEGYIQKKLDDEMRRREEERKHAIQLSDIETNLRKTLHDMHRRIEEQHNKTDPDAPVLPKSDEEFYILINPIIPVPEEIRQHEAGPILRKRPTLASRRFKSKKQSRL